MDWLVWIALAVAAAGQIDTRRKIKALDIKLDGFRVRQGRIAQQRTGTANPPVDSDARTVKRDTNDLPLTGRMSQGVHRRKRNNARADNDN